MSFGLWPSSRGTPSGYGLIGYDHAKPSSNKPKSKKWNQYAHSEVEGNRMPFEKGRTKTGGRKAGTSNQGTLEMKEFALGLLEDPNYQEKLRSRILNGEAPHMEVLLHHYTYGKPKTVLDVNDKSITVIVQRQVPVIEARPSLVDPSLHETG